MPKHHHRSQNKKKNKDHDYEDFKDYKDLNVNYYRDQEKGREEESLDTFIPPFSPPTTPAPRTSP